MPLLGEIVSSGPKGVLIKEAKVKKPSTVPLVNPEEPRQVCITALSKITLCLCIDCAPQFLINETTTKTEDSNLLGYDAVSLSEWFLNLSKRHAAFIFKGSAGQEQQPTQGCAWQFIDVMITAGSWRGRQASWGCGRGLHMQVWF